MSYKEVLLQLNSKQKSAFWLGAAINSCPLSRAVHISRDSVLKELTWKWRKNSAFPRRKIFSSCLTIHVSLKIMWPTLCDKTSLLTNCYFTRHSTMLVGQTGSGKSVCWKILQASMTRLKRDGDSSFNIVRVSPRALSKSQNWPVGPWLDQTFWQWNRLFPWSLAKEPSPLCIIFWIWLIWMASFH